MYLVHQWQITLTIMNGVALSLSALSKMLDSENHELMLPMLGTLSAMFFISVMVKIYVKEYINVDKI